MKCRLGRPARSIWASSGRSSAKRCDLDIRLGAQSTPGMYASIDQRTTLRLSTSAGCRHQYAALGFRSVHPLMMGTPRRGGAHGAVVRPTLQHRACPCLQVGDTVTVHLRSRVHFPLNFVPSGLLGTAANQAQVVAPGHNATYTFTVPAEVLSSHARDPP